ncbi:hypothetical protein HanXRQr2_Chr01g0035771 [Helianthus annuus]|uniref:Uncharacterized protein n=1 Tax=Helianthus annuus TaxID=4232 RepID=A0A9K3JXA1_HELAN|nr:hypothetical protein HanXRQr2_Chr01g0035771 [Helianthus annuus]
MIATPTAIGDSISTNLDINPANFFSKSVLLKLCVAPTFKISEMRLVCFNHDELKMKLKHTMLHLATWRLPSLFAFNLPFYLHADELPLLQACSRLYILLKNVYPWSNYNIVHHFSFL